MVKKKQIYIVLIILIFAFVLSGLVNYNVEGFWLRNPTKTDDKGNPMCLDIINDGQNDKLQLSTCGNYSGQMWSSRDGQLSNGFSVDSEGNPSCLGITGYFNSGKLDWRVNMEGCTGGSWQNWSINENPYAHMLNNYTKDSDGQPSCLNFENDGGNNFYMRPCEYYTNQQWFIADASTPT
jgi:hypothetical protein